MRTVKLQTDWPDSWKYSYPYDVMEIYDGNLRSGYSYAYANRRKHTLEMVQKAAKPGSAILDVAAAQGNFSLALAELGYDVTWNDLRSDLEGYVKLKYEHGSIHFAPGDVFQFNERNQFDIVLITEIIEHVAHPDQFMCQIGRLVKPNGHVVMTTPNGAYLRNDLPKFSECLDPSIFESQQFKPNADGHIFLLHPAEIEMLAERAGLCVQQIELFTNPLTNGHLKLEPFLKVLPSSLINYVERLTSRQSMPFQRKLCTGMAVLLQKL